MEIFPNQLRGRDIRLFVKREDLIHPAVSGNKWRKLKHNLLKAKKLGKKGIITFGGAFSNHIYATAAACHGLAWPSVGIIRGEIDPQNPTLVAARNWGMQLEAVSRSDYRRKTLSPNIQNLIARYPDNYLVPEGGSNDLALDGIAEMMAEAKTQLTPFPDLICVAAGTGCTARGILLHKPSSCAALVVSALKGDFLIEEIGLDQAQYGWRLDTASHFGGYGRVPEDLERFAQEFEADTGLPLDPIYTAKAMHGLLSAIDRGEVAPGSRVLFIHTGGLQGWEGLHYMREKRRS